VGRKETKNDMAAYRTRTPHDDRRSVGEIDSKGHRKEAVAIFRLGFVRTSFISLLGISDYSRLNSFMSKKLHFKM